MNEFAKSKDILKTISSPSVKELLLKAFLCNQLG